MDDYWNASEVASPTLDNFFDEENDTSWENISREEVSPKTKDVISDNEPFPRDAKSVHKISLSAGSLSSILDNISIHSDSSLAGISGSRVKLVGKSFGEKIESWKAPSLSIKWKNDGSTACIQCNEKDEEIMQLKIKLQKAYSRSQVTLMPADTINNMVLGYPYSFENYKRLDEKRSLLVSALKTLDSSSILAVLLFMKKSMKRSLFLKELQNYSLAAQIYLTYLKQRRENVEVLDILGMLGKTEEAAMLKYELAIQSSGDTQIKHLQNALKTHFTDPSLSFESKIVKQHINILETQMSIERKDQNDKNNPLFLEYPRATSLIGQSLLTTLYYCSMYHWNSSPSQLESPLSIKKSFPMSDRQFLWTVLRARTKVKHWILPSELEQLLTTRGLLGSLSNFSGLSGGGKLVKNSLTIERVIEFLSPTGVPKNLLFQYINLFSSPDKKISLGLAHSCHHAVVETYISMKDRNSLEKYLSKMAVGSPEYIRAEQALKSLK